MKKAVFAAVVFLMTVTLSGAAALTDDSEFKAGLKYYNSKNYKAAVKQFKEYLAKKPDPKGYYLTGYALYKLGKFNESEEYFREAFLIDPEFSLEKAGLIRKMPEDAAIKEAATPQ
jgi:tetratricopeptide (TPR) repeat protein